MQRYCCTGAARAAAAASRCLSSIASVVHMARGASSKKDWPRDARCATGEPWTGSPRAKHRDQIGKNCPKKCQKVLCVQPIWTIFGHFSMFVGHFVDIPFFWAVQRFACKMHMSQVGVSTLKLKNVTFKNKNVALRMFLFKIQ